MLYTTDVTVTLVHQPQSYWAGDYTTVIEGNPFFRELLAAHPAVFLGVVITWAIAFVLILRHWRHPLTKPMALILTLGHAVGAGSWLIGYGWLGWVAAIGLLVTAERLLSWSWQTGDEP